MTPTPTAARVSGTIKALEWHDDGPRWIAGLCVILDEEDGYEVDFGGANVAFVGRDSSRDPLGEAKRRAEEWHQAYCLAAIQPDPEPETVSQAAMQPDRNISPICQPEPKTVEEAERIAMIKVALEGTDADFRRYRYRIAKALRATPSSAGMVSVEAAARVIVDACPNPIFDQLKPVLMGEVTERVGYTDEDGNEDYYDRPVSWDAMKTIISAALRALAGEGGR